MYIVEEYAPDGVTLQRPTRKEFDTLDEAREWISSEIEGDFGQWSPGHDEETAARGYRPVEAWHESEQYGCGGYEILEKATISK